MPGFISIGSLEQGHSANVAGQLDGLTRGRPLTAALLVLGGGLLVAGIAASLVRRPEMIAAGRKVPLSEQP
jgi:hypothetical protein